MENLFGRSFWTGTEAERAAFVPTLVGTRFYTEDTDSLYIWDAGWVLIGPSGGGGGTPSGTVVSETSYGQSPTAGVAATFQRGDHSHGTPQLPTIDHSALTGVTATQHHTNANDPTAGEKAALLGTNGTPGSGNRYVTDSDSRNTNARAPTTHSHPESDVTNLVSDLAGKEPANSNIQAHIASSANPHSTTAAQVGALATSAFVGLAKITVGTTPPGSPSIGDLFVDTS